MDIYFNSLYKSIIIVYISYSKDFGAEVRQFYRIITNDTMTDEVKARLLETMFHCPFSMTPGEEWYSDFLMNQARYF